MPEKITVALSRKVSDGNYGSFQATIGIEDEVPEGTSRDSFAASLRSWSKAFLDETLGDLRKEYMAMSEAVEGAGAKVIGPKTVTSKPEPLGPGGELPDRQVFEMEEKPPMPSDSPQEAPASPSGDSAGQKEAQPASDHDYRKTFRIQSFEVAKSSTGDKYLKCFGKAPWKREWVPAWGDVAELLFGEIQDMDLGVIGPPYDLDAVVQMKDDEWKGKKYVAPDKIIEWERVV